MQLKPTGYGSNSQYLIDDLGIIAGIVINEKLRFKLHDTVYVMADSEGSFGVGITDGGYGIIDLIIEDKAERFFGVRMMKSGDFGFVKASQMSWISSRYELKLPDWTLGWKTEYRETQGEDYSLPLPLKHRGVFFFLRAISHRIYRTNSKKWQPLYYWKWYKNSIVHYRQKHYLIWSFNNILIFYILYLFKYCDKFINEIKDKFYSKWRIIWIQETYMKRYMRYLD